MPRWTEEQLDAINKTGTNIIVSAGAGSGKTAVLSERVLRILKEKIHINELLVLTFTNAAASEMKERIRNKIKAEPSLVEELDLIDASYITTFDSFALSLVKKYHYLLNISPDVKIVDSTIIALEKKTILDTIFEDYYAKEDKNFIKLINDFCVKDDQNIRNAILSISSKLDLKTNKQEFIHNYVKNFFENNKIEKDILEYINLINKKRILMTKLLEDLKYEAYGEYYEKIENSLKPLLEAEDYQEIKNNSQIKLPSLPKESTEELKVIKDKINKLVKEIGNLCCYENIDEIREIILSTKEYATVILEIIDKLDEKINLYKFKNDIYEFNDIALLAIKVVKENEEIRLELKETFKEILVDEYQDTNDIQEEFISLISNNNVYMVGDIKQSIYRFRNANPYIFKSKYDNYSNHNGGIKIDLNKNFRSREEVLNNINEIFNLIMDNEIGGADYQKTHNMIFGNITYNEAGKIDENHNLEIISYPHNKETEYKKEEIEAFIIADDIINKVKNKYQVFDKDKQILRDIKYSDFVILMDRTTNFDLYKKIFTFKEIPLNQIKDEKMNDEYDLYVIKNLIKLILKINKNIIDEEFKYLFISIERSFLIREEDNKIFEYFVNNNYEQSDLYQKCLKISYDLDNLSLTELLNKIEEEFDYLQNLITIANIEGSLVRLEKIKESASNLEMLGYSIEEFSNYLEDLITNNYEIKYILNENTDDSVKIMTIHKSKGLEYHICYYSGLYKEFNISDLKSMFIFDNTYGLILPYFKEGIGSTIYKDLLKEKYLKEEISEKIRLFYVALTRAKEKMILVEPSKEVHENQNSNILSEEKRCEYRSFKDILDSIKPNILNYYNEINIENVNIDKNYKLNKTKDLYSYIPTNNSKIELKKIETDKTLLTDNTYSKKQHELLSKELKKNVEYGKKIHRVFELVDFKNPDFSLIDDLTKEKIVKLLNQDIFKNIKEANIMKEYEFIYLKDNNEYQGVIDLMLEYNDHIDIIDYKLKNVEDSAYIEQLNGYKDYIKSLTNKNINLYLYSILDNRLVSLSK